MAEDTTTTKQAEKTEKAKKPAKAGSKRKKRIKRSVAAADMHVQATFNNTIITITDKKGAVLASSSAGACGFRGSKKGTAYAAQIASEKALTEAKQNFNVARVDVFVKGIGLGRDSAIRALHNVDIMVDSIKDVTAIPHGGVRAKKARSG